MPMEYEDYEYEDWRLATAKLYAETYTKEMGTTFPYSLHRTLIRTGITCKKIPCYMRDSACRWFIVKKAKISYVMLNIFEFSRVWENAESWLVYANKLFWIAQPYFSNDLIKKS